MSWTYSAWSLAGDEGSHHLLHRSEGTGVLGSPSQLPPGITRWLNSVRNHPSEPLLCKISPDHKWLRWEGAFGGHPVHLHCSSRAA